MALYRTAVLAVLALVGANARDAPRYEKALLTVKMEGRFAAVEKYITINALTAISSDFTTLKTEIRAELTAQTATEESALTALHEFQFKTDKIAPGFKSISVALLEKSELAAIAIPARWDSVYGRFKALTTSLNNANVTAALETMDAEGVAAIAAAPTEVSMEPPIKKFILYLNEIQLTSLAQSLPTDANKLSNEYGDKFAAIEDKVIADIASGKSSASSKSSAAGGSDVGAATPAPAPAPSTAMSLTLTASHLIAVATVVVAAT